MGIIAGVSIRTALGLSSGIIAGLVGYLVVSIIWPPRGDPLPFIGGLVTASGACGGVGASIAWLKLDVSRETLIRVLMLGLIGGVVGAWSGHFYGQFAYEDALFSRPARISTIMAATVVSNVTLLGDTIRAAVRSRLRSPGTANDTAARRLHHRHL